MLCDERKVYVPQDRPWGLEPEEGGKLVEEETCYLKSDVDAAIDELKTEHHKERHKYIEMVDILRREKAELKQKLEDVQASMYADVVDANMEIRRLKRVLWLARAQRANEHYHRYHGKFLCSLEDIPEYIKWEKVERKCRAKAEEYK